ncbi:MAG: hypothetical protein HYZ02_00020, partial [Candidatus Levybacteria bacterium]|nr:hypothetical protein [Candidatus Levybacteria bacterium]
ESTTRILPDSNAQALPKKYSLKVGSKLSSIKYIVQAVKVGPTADNEPRQVWWIARRAEVALGEGNPPSLMWVFNELKRVYNNGEVIIIELRNPNPQNRPRIL